MNGTAPPLILRRRDRRRVVVRLRLGAIACRQRPHMVLGRWEERHCFYIFFLFTGIDPVRVLGHRRDPVLGVVVWVDLDWRFGWMCGARRVALPHLRRPW